MPPGARSGAVRSLRERALRYLSQREHSRLELARKLAPHSDSDAETQQLLDALAADGWLSESRFARSLVHRRASRYGLLRIQAELDTHGVTLQAHETLRRELTESEIDRAWSAWSRRFGVAPADAADRARQMRFLMQRGFSSETIRTVFVRSRPDPSGA